MGFLDDLENTLKNLEGVDENTADDRRQRDAEQARITAVAPWAAKLKASQYVTDLMSLATRAGYAQRAKVNLVWIGTTLRLELRRDRLELRPLADGVLAVFERNGEELGSQRLDLTEPAQDLVVAWLAVTDPTA